MEITIRKIEIADAETLSAIAKQTFYDTFTGTCTEEDMQHFLGKYFNIPLIKKELEDTDCFNLFAEVNDIPVGYVRFKEDYNDYPFTDKYKAIELKRLYIQKEFHGKGIAHRMMDIYLDYAKQNEYELAWLGVWEYNFRAQKFYGRYGFTDSGFGHDFPIGNTPQQDRWFWKFL